VTFTHLIREKTRTKSMPMGGGKGHPIRRRKIDIGNSLDIRKNPRRKGKGINAFRTVLALQLWAWHTSLGKGKLVSKTSELGLREDQGSKRKKRRCLKALTLADFGGVNRKKKEEKS